MTDHHRSEATPIGPEREQLEAFLHDNRREVLAVVEDLSPEQARRRLAPSLTGAGRRRRRLLAADAGAGAS